MALINFLKKKKQQIDDFIPDIKLPTRQQVGSGIKQLGQGAKWVAKTYLEQPTIQNVYQRRLDAKQAEQAFNESRKLNELAYKQQDQARRQRLLNLSQQIKQPYIGQVGKEKNLQPIEFGKATAEGALTILPFLPGATPLKGATMASKVAPTATRTLLPKVASQYTKAQPQIARAVNLATGAGQGTGLIRDIGTRGFVPAITRSLGRNLASGTTQAGIQALPTPETRNLTAQQRAEQFARNALVNTLAGTAFEGVIGGGVKGTEGLVRGTQSLIKKIPSIKLRPETPTITREPRRLAQQALNRVQDTPIRAETTPQTRVSIQEDTLPTSTKELRAEVENISRFEPTPKVQSTPRNFRQVFGDFVGRRESAELKGIKETLPLNRLDDNSGRLVISTLRGDTPIATIPAQLQDEVRKIRQGFDNARREAMEKGREDIGYIENYLTPIYVKDPKAPKVEGIIPERFASPEEARKFGYKEKYDNPKQILAEYNKRVQRKIADAQFLQELQDNNILTQTQQGNLVPFSSPDINNGQVFYGRKEVVDQLNRYFNETGGSPLKGVADIAGGLQNIALSGGIPFTPFNAFGIGQGIRATTALQVKEFGKGFAYGILPKTTNDYIRRNIDTFIAMQERNIPITSNLRIPTIDKGFWGDLFDSVDEEVGVKRFANKAGKVFNSVISDPTFKRTMPIYQAEVFKNNYNIFRQKGLSDEQAKDLASDVVKTFFGIRSSDERALSNKATNDLLSIVFFAPRYREAMINFWKSNAEAFTTGILDPKYRANRAFMVMAGLTYAGYNYVNYQNTGKNLWENNEFDKDKAIIDIGDGNVVKVPILPTTLTIPKALWQIWGNLKEGELGEAGNTAYQTFASMLIKPIVDTMRNSDFFGRKIYNEQDSLQEKITKAYNYGGRQVLPTWIKALGKTEEGNYILNLAGLGLPEEKLKDTTWQEIIAEGGELPIKFSTMEKIERQAKTAEWKKDIETITKGLSDEDKKAWEVLHPPKTNSFGEEMLDENKRASKYTRAGIYYNNPAVREADRQYNEILKAKGLPANPFFDLPINLQNIVLQKEILPPSATDPQLSKLNDEEWYQDYKVAQGNYYEQIKANLAKEGKTMKTPQNPYPERPQRLAEVMDYYSSLPKGTGERSRWIEANPSLWQQMTAQWNQEEAWRNKERLSIGLAEVKREETTYPKRTGKGKGKGKRITKASLLAGEKRLKDIPKIKGNLQLVKLKAKPKSPTIKLKRTLPKPALKLKTKPAKKIPVLRVRDIRVK